MEKSAGIILFREKKGQREYLLLKYIFKSKYWGFAKGNIEQDESEQDTALREVKEETGLEKITLNPKFKEKISYFLRRDGKIMYKEVIWFLGKVEDKTDGKVSTEHEELIWLPYHKALGLVTFKKDKGVLMKAEERLQKSQIINH